MNIDISNAHCGPRIQFPDHSWLRVVYNLTRLLGVRLRVRVHVRVHVPGDSVSERSWASVRSQRCVGPSACRFRTVQRSSASTGASFFRRLFISLNNVDGDASRFSRRLKLKAIQRVRVRFDWANRQRRCCCYLA